MPAPTEVTNVVIEKGMSFSLEFDISNDDGTDYSLSGFTTAYATIRKHAKSTIKEDFTSSFTAAGVITISLDTTQTSNLEVGRNYFDVVLATSGGTKEKFIRGSAIVEDTMVP